MNFGEKIKDIRIAQGLTQEELGQRCELTKGFISQIERNLTSPSIASFIDILDALGIRPSDFFQEDREKIIFTGDDFSEYSNEENGYKISWLVPNSQKNYMEPTLIELQPGGKSEFLNPYDGEEFGYVLSGNLELNYGEEKYDLKGGDSFYFPAKKNHQLKNKSKEKKLQVLWISSPPNF